MKYTIPYDDKVTLPHIKKIESIGINADNLYYDTKELTGEVIITGDYLLDNSNDTMEFKHDIPVSFLIDDESITPQINISNFKYELIPGRGIEVMFDLDVILTEELEKEEAIVPRLQEDEQIKNEEIDSQDKISEQSEDEAVKEFQEKIDENLDSVLQNRKKKKEKQTQKLENDEEKTTARQDIEEQPVSQEEVEDEAAIQDIEEQPVSQEKVEDEAAIQDIEEQPISQEKVEEEAARQEKENIEEQPISQEEVEEEPTTEAVVEEYPEDEIFSTNLQATLSSFDTGFIPRDNDKYTTYKILLVEKNETIEELLNTRNLSKALICKEYQFDDQKIVLKLEDEEF